jgi:hypothetical protein
MQFIFHAQVNLGLIRSIAVNQMSMDFTPANPWAPTTSSNSIVATMLSIPGITLPIDSVAQHIIIAVCVTLCVIMCMGSC